VDVLQVGARNMQNFNLLRAIGETRKSVLLKRGLSATIEELLMSAEYILAGGNKQVMLCERGIRTFETSTRNTTDINAVPVLKNLTHLPVILDPSHATGLSEYVPAIARAAIAAGADGLIVEVHPDPSHAVSDGKQSLKPEAFAEMVKQVKAIAEAMGRRIAPIKKPVTAGW
jgi:3-deoxy-7-phosphoheptulonate synthase